MLFSRQAHESTKFSKPLFMGVMRLVWILVPACQLLPCAPEQPWGYANGCRKWNFKTLQLLHPVFLISWGPEKRRPSTAMAWWQRACRRGQGPCAQPPEPWRVKRKVRGIITWYPGCHSPCIAVSPSSNGVKPLSHISKDLASTSLRAREECAESNHRWATSLL